MCGHGSLHCLLRVEAREHARNQRRGNFGAKGLCSGVKKVENILKLLSVIIWNSTSKRSLNMCAVHLCLLPACFAESLFWTGAPLCVTLLGCGWKPSADLCHVSPIGRCPVSPTFSKHFATYRRHVASHSFHDLTETSMNSRCAANLLLLASLLVRSSTSLSADRRHNKRRIRSTSHKEVTAENYHVLQPHNFLENKDTAKSVPLPSARIVGGTETQPNRYPYMVSLQKVFARKTAGGTTLVFFAQKCGGTLIAEGKQGGRKTHT